MVKNTSLLDFATENTKAYGAYTIEQRALPDFRDGLKPVQRRILWATHKMGIHSAGSVKKSARIVGEVIGKFHPHGDSAAYEALAKMTQFNEPLIHGGESNFGDYEDKPAAQRYTECKLSSYSDKYLLDPDYLALVPMVSNYDGEYTEPVFLPSKVPNLIVNGTEGIATGCACLIPSFSLDSVIKLVNILLNGEQATPKICAKILKFQFTYGGKVNSSKKDIREYFESGFQTLFFMPAYSIEDDGKFVIKSISPRFNVRGKLEKLSSIKGVQRVEDKRGGGNIRFDVLINKRHSQEDTGDKIVDSLLTNLNCKTYTTTRLKDGETVKFNRTNIPKFLDKWVKWRVKFEKKVIKRLVAVEKGKKLIQEWLLFAIENKKEIISSLETSTPEKYLMNKMKISEEQVKFILDLKVRSLAKAEKDPVHKKIKQHSDSMVSLRKELEKPEKRVAKGFAI